MLGFITPIAGAATQFDYGYHFECVTTLSGPIDPTPVPRITGMVLGSFHAVGYPGNSTGSTTFTWRPNQLGGINGDDDFSHFTGHLNKGKYFEVTLAPEAGYTLNIEYVDFLVRRSCSGIRSYAVRSSVDEFAANLPAMIATGNTNLHVAPDDSFQWVYDAIAAPCSLVGSRNVLSSDFDALSGPVSFRFYGWNAEGTEGSFGIDNVEIRGSVQEAPEPGAGAGLALGLILFRAARRRRWKS
jgi:hypothetical protein